MQFRNHVNNRRSGDYGEKSEIAAFLVNQPRTIDEIIDHFQSYLFFFGLFTAANRLGGKRRDHMRDHINETVSDMETIGWVSREGDLVTITESGTAEGKKLLDEMHRTRLTIQKILNPINGSKVGVVAHFLLAVLKLTAGWVSGSIGLLNDALDTLLDGIASVLVFIGLKFNREKIVNIILVFLMLGTGIFGLYEAVMRFFNPVQPEIGWLPVTAALLSLLICAMLGAYQRFLGLRSASMALITQSVDSRNHIIVAVSVLIGFLFISINIYIVDVLVGFFVAMLIMKSGIELAVELAKSLRGEELDFGQYQLGLSKKYDQFRVNQFRDWLLYMTTQKKIIDRSDLMEIGRDSSEFNDNPALNALGFTKLPNASTLITEACDELFNRQWIAEKQGRLVPTQIGHERLAKYLKVPKNLPYLMQTDD